MIVLVRPCHTSELKIDVINTMADTADRIVNVGGMPHSHRLPPAELSHKKPKPDASAAAVMGMTKPYLLQQMRFNFNEK